MPSFDPQNTPLQDFYQYLTGAVAPRPIAFVSTLDENGARNLAPFSYFNVFSSSPPILGFAPGNKKDTLANVKKTGECVVNMVSFPIVQQMNVTSAGYPHGVDEFVKSGLTPLASDLVKPFRVKESPVQMECKIDQIIELGKEPTSGTLVLCRVLRMHVEEEVLDANGRIDPQKIDLMGRMGRAYYSRSKMDVHTILQPREKQSMGFDQLPAGFLESSVFTGNDLGQFAALEALPFKEEALGQRGKDPRLQKIMFFGNIRHNLHLYAQELLAKGDVQTAAKIALLGEYI